VSFLDRLTGLVIWVIVIGAAAIGALVILGVLRIGNAEAASSISPTLPQDGLPYSASIIRNQFQRAIIDIDALQNLNAGPSPPSNPSAGYLWLKQPQSQTIWTVMFFDGVQWIPLFAVDSINHLSMPPIGGGNLPSLLTAVTTDLGSVPEASLYLTGANTIQSFGSTAPAGTIKVGIFQAGAVLTSSSSLLLPGGANIAQQAGDVMIALNQGAGVWKVLFDTRVSGGGGGGGGGGGPIPLGVSFTATPGVNNASPLPPGSTLYGQTFAQAATALSVPATLAANQMGGLWEATGGSVVPFVLGAAGTVGFENGVGVCFVGVGTGGFSLAASSPSLLQGVQTSGGVASYAQYSNACAVSNGTNWDVSTSNTDRPYDIAFTLSGLPVNSQRIAFAVTRAATCSAGFPGAVGIARVGATASAVVTINQVTGVTVTARGTLTWGAGGSSYQAATIASASGMVLAPGDLVQAVFPATADATLGDVAITINCQRY